MKSQKEEWYKQKDNTKEQITQWEWNRFVYNDPPSLLGHTLPIQKVKNII